MILSMRYSLEKCGYPLILFNILGLEDIKVYFLMDTGSTDNSLNEKVILKFPNIAETFERESFYSGTEGVVTQQKEWAKLTLLLEQETFQEEFAIIPSETFDKIRDAYGVSIGGILGLNFILNNKMAFHFGEDFLCLNTKLGTNAQARSFPIAHGINIMGMVLIPVQFNPNNDKQTLPLLIDTGSNVSLLDRRVVDFFNPNQKADSLEPIFGSQGQGKDMDLMNLAFIFNGENYEDSFSIIDDPNVFDNHQLEGGEMFYGTLGCNFLKKYGWLLNFENFQLYH